MSAAGFRTSGAAWVRNVSVRQDGGEFSCHVINF